MFESFRIVFDQCALMFASKLIDVGPKNAPEIRRPKCLALVLQRSFRMALGADPAHFREGHQQVLEWIPS